LVAYKGALRAGEAVTRSREEARARAQKLLVQLRDAPDTFAALVQEHSDGPRSARGGPMGIWTVGRNNKPPVFDRVLSAMRVGQVAGQLVESPFGFHILKRERFQKPKLLAASHILVAYAGARRGPIKVKRTREEALALAKKLARRLRARPYRFEAMAKKHSDDPEGARGGHLGTWALGKGIPEFETAVLRLRPGKVSAPVETPAGFHIIKRHTVKR
jgi:peptidyl-prolyl cis-trans isomerase SurA